MAQGEDIVPISSTKRITFLEENVGATDLKLPANDLAALDAAAPRDAVVGARYGDLSHIDG
jgi:aryl-alcohol dehydrogenase-like predicted oxidoreductase